jgi:hypothetical protein
VTANDSVVAIVAENATDDVRLVVVVDCESPPVLFWLSGTDPAATALLLQNDGIVSQRQAISPSEIGISAGF